MPAALPENFLFIPDRDPATSGTLFELDKQGAYSSNSFVLIPYSNPQIKKPEPQFYAVKNKTKITDLSDFKASRSTPSSLQLLPSSTKQQYLEHVGALKQHIQRGDIYEINYCIQFYADNILIDPIEVFIRLNALAKAPYTALVKIGHEFIISASPELFLKKEALHLYSKPIKGTIRRGTTPAEDEALKQHLYHNLKERTENVMAVDVARNDLSRVAKKASVNVNKLYNIETFETVHQMVSTVSCELRENISFDQLTEAAFPMASMTGAPKIRAMQLISQHENFDRRYYSGAMGLVDEAGDFSLSVIIRSIFYNAQTSRVSFAVGSAITYLSDPEQEYEECLLKAKALIKSLDAIYHPGAKGAKTH